MGVFVSSHQSAPNAGNIPLGRKPKIVTELPEKLKIDLFCYKIMSGPLIFVVSLLSDVFDSVKGQSKG